MKNKTEDDTETERSMPSVVEGQTFENMSASITEYFTTPLKPYTEDTLLSAMESAGKEDMPEDAERKGLGTPATGASIIKKPVSSDFAERKKKPCSHKGRQYLDCGSAGGVDSSLLTVEQENTLTQIAQEVTDPDDFMQDIECMAKGLCATYYSADPDKKALFELQRESLVEQLQKSPEPASALASLIAAQAPAK